MLKMSNGADDTNSISMPSLTGTSTPSGAKSVNQRSVANHYKMTLMQGRDDLNTSMSLNARSPHLFRSNSVSSIGNTAINSEDKMQRSQLNIDKKMREDFDRIQNQLKKRKEKETAAQEQARY